MWNYWKNWSYENWRIITRKIVWKEGFIGKDKSHNKRGEKQKFINKYCEYHKTKSHSNEECRQQRKDKQKKPRESKRYSTCEDRPTPKTIGVKSTFINKIMDFWLTQGVIYFSPNHLLKEIEVPKSNNVTKYR